MNKLQLNNSWDQIKGRLKQRYPQLTDADLELVEGKEDELLSRLEQRIGETEENIRNMICAL